MGWIALLSASLFCAATPTETASVADTQLDYPPAKRIRYQNLTGARINPLGLSSVTEIVYRSRIYKSDNPAFKDNHIGFGLNPAISPAYSRGGVLLEVQPMTVLRLWTAVELVGYYGTFDLLQSFPSPNAEYSDQAIKDLGDLGGDQAGYATGGIQITFGATFQIKVGPIAARNLLRFSRSQFDLRDGDRVFFDSNVDLLVPDNGWFFVNDVDLLFVTNFGLAAGARWSSGGAFFTDDHFASGEADLDLNPVTHRVGPFVAYRLFTEPDGALFNKPTIIFIANWYLSHRYRTGQDTSQALPYLGFALLFSGDLWIER